MQQFLDINEGPQIFKFANNESYEAFYYDNQQRNKISRRLCKKSGYDHVTFASTETFDVNHLSNEFHDCLNYIANYKTNAVQDYIKCHIVKNVTCGESTIEHRDKNDVQCEWNRNETTSKFSITIRNKKNVSTNSHFIPKFKLGSTDLIGYLTCRVSYDWNWFDIEEPFVLRNDNPKMEKRSDTQFNTDMFEMSGGPNAIMFALVCICIGGVGISLFVYFKNKKIVGRIMKPR